MTATDPVCRLAPDHGLIEAARDEAVAAPATPLPVEYRAAR